MLSYLGRISTRSSINQPIYLQIYVQIYRPIYLPTIRDFYIPTYRSIHLPTVWEGERESYVVVSCRCAFVVAVCAADLQLIAVVVVVAAAAFSRTPYTYSQGMKIPVWGSPLRV
jgi:hypothetical protein